jgi:hypothetical protein
MYDMLFSLLLLILHLAISISARFNKRLKLMIKTRNNAYVIMTKDGKTGRRFIFKNGRYSSDKLLTEYDMAMVFENGDIGFRTLAFGGDHGVQDAINNWKLKIRGDNYHVIWFSTVMAMALRQSARK